MSVRVRLSRRGSRPEGVTGFAACSWSVREVTVLVLVIVGYALRIVTVNGEENRALDEKCGMIDAGPATKKKCK